MYFEWVAVNPQISWKSDVTRKLNEGWGSPRANMPSCRSPRSTTFGAMLFSKCDLGHLCLHLNWTLNLNFLWVYFIYLCFCAERVWHPEVLFYKTNSKKCEKVLHFCSLTAKTALQWSPYNLSSLRLISWHKRQNNKTSLWGSSDVIRVSGNSEMPNWGEILYLYSFFHDKNHHCGASRSSSS